MVDSIKITALQDIGANIAYTTLVPVVNMAGTPTTQKSNLQNVGNLILNGAGGSYFPRAAQATLALNVANAAQPNITSVGTLTSLAVTGNITAANINGGNLVVANFFSGDGGFLTNVAGGGSNYSNSNVANYLPTYAGNVGASNVNVTGTVYANGLSSTGLASLTTVNVAANLGVANIRSASNLGVTANTLTWNFTDQGVLQWPGGIGQIDTNNSTFEIHSTNGLMISTNEANSSQSFLFDTAGVFTSPGNVNLLGSRLNVGPDAANVTNLVNPTLIIANTGAEFIQAAIINNDGNGSSDWSADGADGGDDEAWTDMGFAGFSFNDPIYTITAPGDGYMFVQSYANGLGGNMILATGDNSNTADIIFATGGFLSSNEFARIDHANDVFHLTRANSGIRFADGTTQTTAATGGNGTYGDSNVVSLLSAFGSNTIATTGNVSVGNIIGNGQALTNIAGANVSGTVGNANLSQYLDVSDVNNNFSYHVVLSAGSGDKSLHIDADDNLQYNPSDGTLTATRVDATYVLADLQYSNGYPAANVTGLGNIATINLTGSNANVLYGNGVFAAVAGGGGSTGNVTFDNVTVQGVNGLNLSAGADFTANLAYLQVRAGDVASHIHLDTGNNSAYDLIVGDDQNYVQVSSTGNILLSSYDSNTAQYIWTLDYNGNLILAGGNSVIQSIANSSLDTLNPNVSTMVFTPDQNYNSQALVLDPTLTGHIHLRAPGANIDEPAANIFLGGEDTAFEITSGAINQAVIHSNGKSWTFGNDGNISSDTLTFTTTFANVKTVEYQTAGVWDLYVEDGITGSNTASSRLNVSFKDNLIDKPQVYIENTKENDGIALRWTFDENGNLNFPRDVAGNSDPYLSIFGGATPTIQSTDASLAGPANLAIQSNYLNLSGFSGDKIVFYADTGEMATDANMTLTTNLANTGNTSSWTFSDDGLLTLPGGNVVIGSLLGSEAILASNVAFGVVSQGNGSTVLQWIDDVSNASALSAIYINSPSGNTGDVVVLTGEPGANANIWTFGADGILTVPGNLVAVSASPAPSISGFSSVSALAFTNGNSNVTVNANSNLWNFDSTGNLTIPGTSGGFIKTASNASIGIAAVDNGTNNPAQLLSLNAGTGAATSIVSAYATNVAIQTNASGTINTWSFSADGNLTLPGNTVAIKFANNSSAFGNMVQWTTAPLANTSAGTAGQAAYDSGGNLYVCVATNTWSKFSGTTSW